MRRIAYVSLAVVMLAGCANNAQNGALIGGLGGGGMGAILGQRFGGRNGALLGGIAGAAAGAMIGGAIGRSLDERDQQRAYQAQLAAFNQPIYYPAAQTMPFRPGPASAYPAPAYAPAAQPAPTPSPTPPSPPAPVQVARRNPQPSTPFAGSAAPSQAWSSDHSGARGSATVVSVEPPTSTSGECRVVQQLVVVRGKEMTEPVRKCRDPERGWVEQA